MAKAKVTSKDIIDALREHYGLVESRLEMEEWALLTEVPLTTQTTSEFGSRVWGSNKRTIDVLLLRNWGGGKQGFDRLAVEVKVSKADYKNETDDKREPAWVNAHRCAYACPPGIIEVGHLPEGWGLMWVYPEPITDVAVHHRDYGKRISWRKVATRHEPTGDPIRLLHTLARRASRAEERMRTGDGDAAVAAALRIEVDRLHARLANRDNAIARQRARAQDAIQRLRAQGEQRCADCHEVVKATLHQRSFDRGSDGFWTHADKDKGETCRLARSEVERLRREQETGSRYSPRSAYAGPVETEAERAERLREWETIRAEDAAYTTLTTEEDRREEHRYG